MTDLISIVIPVYNAEKSLRELTDRIKKVMTTNNYRFEIIYVNDSSVDNSAELLNTLHHDNEFITAIHLDRNAGQHAATFCGLKHAKGEFAVVMCDDLQHDPEEIPKFIQEIEKGFDVVYANLLNKQRKMVIGSWIMQKLLHITLHVPKNISISDFFIVKRKILDRIVFLKPSHVQYNALIISVTNPRKISNISVLHQKRKYGKTTYSHIKYIKILLDLLINHSSIPLQCIAIIGILVSFASFVLAAYLVLLKIISPTTGLEGWTSLMVVTSFLLGIILFSLSILGEYIRRMFHEVDNRPPYYIGEILLNE